MAEKKKFDFHNLLVRCLSGAVILTLTLTFGILGNWFWYGFISVVSVLGLFEFYRAFQIHNKPIGFIGFLFGVSYWVLLALRLEYYVFYLIIGAFLLLMGAFVFDFERISSKQAMASLTGLVYTVVLLSFWYLTRMLPDGKYLIWYTFIGSWVCDSAAYFAGVAFGRHKLAPVLSPKKSVEGVIGGVIGASLFGVIFGLVFREKFAELRNPILASGVICGAAGLIGVIGDLTASAFKRNQNIKDYSHLIPGHGGILDRFDSVIFVAPVIYFGAWIFTKVM